MKICVLLPSSDAVRQAGVRIRYGRIEASLHALGHEFCLAPLQDFSDPSQFVHDAYVFSKCYDARAILAARMLANSSQLVGVDLFDDYFSQAHDSRILRFRSWLRAMTQAADFILCSTPAMQGVARAAAPHLATHVMNDPGPKVDADRLRSLLATKLDRARRRREINLCWFGMGDNAHYPVGLADLAAFGGELAALRRQDFKVTLAIQTNARALTPEALARLRRLPVPHTIEEWSEGAEARLLGDSLACFLPVNAQNFSITKSLNRAMTTLSSGVQVLSGGYPLYKPLSSFIYKEYSALAKDVDGGKLLLGPDSVDAFSQTILAFGDREREAAGLAAFLTGLGKRPRPAKPRHPRPFAMVHGTRTSKDVASFARAMGALSIASPFCIHPWEFDAVFRLPDARRQLEVYLSHRVWPSLPPKVACTLSAPWRFGQYRYRSIDVATLGVKDTAAGIALAKYGNTIGWVASYPSIIKQVEAITGLLFPGIACVLSERSVFPLAAEQPSAIEGREAANA